MTRIVGVLLSTLLTFCALGQSVNWSTGVVYEYDGSGNVKKIGTDTYFYDTAQRLIRGSVAGSQQSYSYDSFGNRTACEGFGGSDCQWDFEIDSATNQVEGRAYDKRGNMLQLPDGNTLEYDELGMLRKENGTGRTVYSIYTADDERIAVYEADTLPATPTHTWRWTVRGLDKKPLREFTSDTPAGTGNFKWSKDHIWREGVLLASHQADTAATGGVSTYHYHVDHLGTPRQVTNPSAVIIGRHDYLPFGPELTNTKIDEPRLQNLKFTGHERDEARDRPPLDYMHARYYEPRLGRFLSVDPSPKLRLQQPQSWNRYAYSLNNPLKYVDPDGQDAVVFIVSSGPKWDQKGGHAAAWVESGNRQGGVSRGGYDIGKNGWKDFLAHYMGQGREVHAYILKTTDAQDQAMLNFIDQKGDAAGTDVNKSVQTCGLTENCASAVVNVLQAGGVVPANSDPSAARGANSPFVLKNELDNGQLQPQVQRHIDFVPPQPEKKESWWSRLIDRIF